MPRDNAAVRTVPGRRARGSPGRRGPAGFGGRGRQGVPQAPRRRPPRRGARVNTFGGRTLLGSASRSGPASRAAGDPLPTSSRDQAAHSRESRTTTPAPYRDIPEIPLATVHTFCSRISWRLQATPSCDRSRPKSGIWDGSRRRSTASPLPQISFIGPSPTKSSRKMPMTW